MCYCDHTKPGILKKRRRERERKRNESMSGGGVVLRDTTIKRARKIFLPLVLKVLR
jgi:hypothetical protein